MTFENYPTTPKYRFSGMRLTCLEVLGVLAFWELQRTNQADETGALQKQALLYLWRRFCASNLEHEQWRKKAWASLYNNSGHSVWFPRVMKRLRELELVIGYTPTSTLKPCAISFVERMQPAMTGPDFSTYTRNTHAKVNGRLRTVRIP